MTAEQIRELASGLEAQLVETHISWVLLNAEFAWKIKKPVRFGFLDFSTPDLRRFYCEEEVRLNRRLAPAVYLGVQTVGLQAGKPVFGAEPVIDYAVQMRRLDNALEMDRLLLAGAVQPAQMEQLAEILVKFHHDVTLHNYADCEPGAAWADFADIANHVGLIEKHFGAPAAADLQSRLPELEKQLHHHDKRLQQRAREGFWVEGHGDLHSRNIFLTNPPLAFDCIEFSAHLRKMDLLNELAFLAMDLDFYHRPDLAKIFLHAYLKRRNIMPQPEDRQLFIFFKAYRANVRLKIGLLEMEQHPSQALVENTRRYWQLFGQYLTTLLTAGF